MVHVKAFIAGFLATLTFHQGLAALLHAAGFLPRAPFQMTPTAPFHVPAVISLSFWAGLWGIILWQLIRGMRGGWAFWIAAFAFGALVPSLVGLFIIYPLKGLPMAGGWHASVFLRAFLLNGAWGVGTAVFMRLFTRGRAAF